MTVVNYFLDYSCRLIRLLFLCSSEVNNYVWKFKFNKHYTGQPRATHHLN